MSGYRSTIYKIYCISMLDIDSVENYNGSINKNTLMLYYTESPFLRDLSIHGSIFI